MTVGDRAGSGDDHPFVAAVRPIAEAMGATIVDPAMLRAGDVPLCWENAVVAGFRPPDPGRMLDSMIETVERELGVTLHGAPRATRQEAVRRLEERGAFTMRKSVEIVADALGVSRFTIYNYLNRGDGGS